MYAIYHIKYTISNMDPQICRALFRNPVFLCMLPKNLVFIKQKRSFFSGYWALYMISKIAYGNLLGFGVG